MQDLSGTWSLCDAAGEYRLDMVLPGDGITALEQAGRIPDPYFGQNEYDLRWIAEREWTVTRTFTVADTNQVLVLSDLDCVATVRVNGETVLRAANAYLSYRVPLGAVLRMGENEIAITFHSTPAEGQRRADAQPFPVPFSQNCPIPHGNLIRKPHCDFGWDWNLALAPFGLYGDLYLEPALATRITRLDIRQTHADGTVHVDVSAHFEGPPVEVAFTFAGQQVTGESARFTVEDPALWWPAGQGPQPLHDLTAAIPGQTLTRRIGLTQIEHIVEQDAAGTGFLFRVNGRDIFAKGANWIPADALPGRITREATRDLLQSAVDANMNMIRIWGGGRYEPDWFYDLCDELGLMVWQDFMFACSLYPADDAFLAEVAEEVRQQTARLHHHASIALWCGDNELIGALTWYEESLKDRDRYLVAYDRLNRTIETALKETCPQANWWPSSPSPGTLNFGDAWHDDTSGDMHFWSVWHEGRDFDHYRVISPRFCSEFGFQSYPSMDVVRSFAAPEDHNIAAPVLEAHQKNEGGNARIAETMFRYFRFPEGFENFVYLSQVQQALAIETAVRHWRGLKPHCMGALYWQLNDTWPVASWASLDYGGGWKVLHHFARRFFAPVTVVAVPEPTGIALRGINDTTHPVEMSLTVSAVTPQGVQRPLGRVTHAVGTGAADPLFQVAALQDDELLLIAWDSDAGSGHEHFAPRPYKAYDLVPSGLNLQATRNGDTWALRLTAETLALFATVEADQPGRFSDNAVTVLPDRPSHLTFTPRDPAADVTFTLRDLHSATYGRPHP